MGDKNVKGKTEMKTILAILLAAALLLGFAACGREEIPDQANGILVADFSAGNPEPNRQEHDWVYTGDLTVENIAMGLSELTGMRFDVSAQMEGSKATIDWSPESALLSDAPIGQNGEYRFFDYDSLVWFLLDSLHLTILKNLPDIREVYYTMDGGKELALENLWYPKSFTLDTPYMGSAFYLAHAGGRGDDEEPVDPADVRWAGEYGSEKGMLHIVNYDGASFRFTLTSENDTPIEGAAALDPENPLFAEYMQLSFYFNLSDETINCAGGDYGAFEATYIRTENAVG